MFDMKAKGFGLLARGVGYYAPASVHVLLTFLAKRCPDPSYFSALARAAQQAAKAYLDNRITIANQVELARSITMASCIAASRNHQSTDQTPMNARQITLDSIEEIDAYIGCNPMDPLGYHARGSFYLRSGKSDLAIRDFSEAIARDPTRAIDYYNRGFCWASKNEYVRAIADFTTALQHYPAYAAANIEETDRADYIRRMMAMAQTKRGMEYRRIGQAEKAMRDYDEAISLDCDCALAYLSRGHLAIEAGRRSGNTTWFTSAIADFTELLRIAPNHGFGHFYRAYCYRQVGEETLAREDFVAAHRLDPEVARDPLNE
jgi:tetratricopeptide (TPR) repeat protein